MIYRNIKTKYTFLYLILFYLFLNTHAQAPQPSVSIDTNAIRLGEQVKLTLQLRFPAQDMVQFPQFNDTITTPIEIIEKGKLDTAYDEADITTEILTQQFIITSFDSGYHVIPPFKFIINRDTVESNPLLLEVHTVSLDTAQAIKDIKPPIDVSYTIIDWLKDYWQWIAGSIAILGIIALIVYLLKTKKVKPIQIIPKAPPKPAHTIALEKLDLLKSKKLWQQDKVKQYHSELSEIAREYLENRYHVMALEQTTDEILIHLRTVSIDEESKNRLAQLLRLSDLVKFAKEKPIASENDLCMTHAYDFVNNTKLTETQPNNV